MVSKCLCPNGPTVFHNGAGGDSTCMECGIVFSENTLVSEVSFGETSGGAAMAHGTLISDESTHARSGGHNRHGGGPVSREQVLNNGRQKIQQVANMLSIPDTVAASAFRFYTLAVEHRFTKGRQSILVAAACLYAACQHTKAGLFLIDFSDKLQVNVFVLGATYLKLIKFLHLPRPYVMDPSHYISRFAALLEFGDETPKVATDATRLVRRFRYDWMNTGRRPAGICGACLLLAARMNNFRRSIQEIVQVVKIADATLLKRLHEFKNTSSALMTVADFRDESKWLPESHEAPPIVKEQEKKKLKARKRKRSDGEEGDIGEYTQENAQEEARGRSPSLFRPRDIPETTIAQPINFQGGIFEGVGLREEDLNPASTSIAIKSRPPLFVPDEDDDMVDGEGEEERTDIHTDPHHAFDTMLQYINNDDKLEEDKDDDGIGEEVESVLHGPDGVQVEAELEEVERHRTNTSTAEDTFEDLDDDELNQFLLSEEEVRLKTRVWVELNRDYLEKIAAKGVDEEEGALPKKRQKPKKPRSKPRDSTTARGATPAEAVGHLLKKKKFSRKINYDAVKSLFKSPQVGTSSKFYTVETEGWQGGQDEKDDEDKDDEENGMLISMDEVIDEGAADISRAHFDNQEFGDAHGGFGAHEEYYGDGYEEEV